MTPTITMPTRYTLPRPTFTHPETGATMPNDTGWQDRHLAALRAPAATTEAPYLALVAAWQAYAVAHTDRYDEPIGENGYAGDLWQAIGAALAGLLNMDHGRRLDNATLDALIRDIARTHGVEGEL